MRSIARAIALLFVIAGLATIASPAQAFVDRDCSDFSTQAQAQQYMSPGDPHGLDRDGDGRACDSLPCPCSGSSPQPVASGPVTLNQRARVVRVIDGDTVDVRLNNGARKRVRLLGIDTPETNRCYGRKATQVTKGILKPGTRVLLTSDTTQARKDRYGRLLRYVTKGKVDVNKRLVYLGAAKVYVYNRKPFKRTSAYKNAQRSAKAHQRGLWRACR